MTDYSGIARLREDLPFTKRVTTCAFERANIFKDDERPEFVALSMDVLKGAMPTVLLNYVCNAPGFAAEANDSTQIEDDEIMSAVDSVWPMVAALLYP